MTNDNTYTLSVLTEDKAGLLNHITIIFTRRKINIDSLNVSSTEVPGISRFTIVTHSNREMIDKIVKQIRKLIDVIDAFVYEDDQIHYQEVALYKVPTQVFLNGNKIENLVRNNGARILVIKDEYIVIEKTGHKLETQELFNQLEPFGVLEFVRSGRVAISMSKRKTTALIQLLEESTENKLALNAN